MTVTELRQKHPRFVYRSYEVVREARDLVLRFQYFIDADQPLITTLRYCNVPDVQLDDPTLQNWALSLGMIEAFSYWKATCSPEFVIEAGYFTEAQVAFWKELLQKGLSEFFFVNHIDGWSDEFVQFQVIAPAAESHPENTPHAEKALIPVGGGKDSAVTMALLKNFSIPQTVLTVQQNAQVTRVLEVAQLGEAVKVERQLDPRLTKLNAQGYLNGHTPFSAMLAFASTLAAYLYNFRYVVLSNEFSANEGNTTFLGQPINHQYSKTLEFERNFRHYLVQYLSTTIEYFSFLRPLHELQIAQLFAKTPEYWPVFLSCNRGQKTGRWCGECPKCLFVFIMLSAFLTPAELEGIFHQNLLANAALEPIFDELTGLSECKSLECVGTREETVMALSLALQKYQGQELPYLLQRAQAKLPIAEPAQPARLGVQSQHFLPAAFYQQLVSHLS